MEEALLVYDGDCGFCSSCARWLELQWVEPARAVAWQLLPPGELERLGLTAADVARSAWWLAPDGTRSGGHDAIARSLAAARGWRGLAGKALLVPPLSWAGRAAYPVVARNRHHLPGGTPACKL